MTVLAIDQGTTNTSAFLLERDGSARRVHVAEHAQHYPQSGWVEHDPEALMKSLWSCIDAAGSVSAIGIDNQGESCLAWHAETKEAVSPVIVWQDNRTQGFLEDLKADGVAELVLEKTGLPLESYFSASKLGWIVKTLPEASRLLEQGKLRLGTTDAFFLDRLTGSFVTDITTASRTSLMDLERGQWDDDLCRVFGVPMNALPEIVSTTGDFGTVARARRHAPITASIVDQQAALFGHGCRNKGDAKITFGTGAFALAVTGEEIFRAPQMGLLPTVAWKEASMAPVYALDGGVYCAASAVNWARDLGLFDDLQEIGHFSGSSAIERDLAFVPALSGLACPYWDRSAAGLWIGLSLDTTREDLIRAILEGVALRAGQVLEAMADFVAFGNEISIDGGMSANPYFCQFLADVLERKVVVPAMGELTALGTALLAAKAGGIDVLQSANEAQLFEPGRNLTHARARFAEAVDRARGWSVGR